jgi:hypothetical protein
MKVFYEKYSKSYRDIVFGVEFQRKNCVALSTLVWNCLSGQHTNAHKRTQTRLRFWRWMILLKIGINILIIGLIFLNTFTVVNVVVLIIWFSLSLWIFIFQPILYRQSSLVLFIEYLNFKTRHSKVFDLIWFDLIWFDFISQLNYLIDYIGLFLSNCVIPGKDVRVLQNLIIRSPFVNPKIALNNVYDTDTVRAVKQFQEGNHMYSLHSRSRSRSLSDSTH